jgi:hypothetical protein
MMAHRILRGTRLAARVQAAEAAVGCTSRKDATFLRRHRSTSIRWQNGSRRAAWIEWNQSEHKPMGLFIISFFLFCNGVNGHRLYDFFLLRGRDGQIELARPPKPTKSSTRNGSSQKRW